MRRIALLLCGLLLCASANAAVTYTPGQWKLYRSGSIVLPYHASAAACDAALHSLPIAIGTTVTLKCQQSVTAMGVANPPPPPGPVNCVVSSWGPWTGGAWSACVSGSQTRTETRTRSIVTPPANGGNACPVLSESRTATQGCTMPPQLGNATVSWTPPTTRADGSTLTNLAGYRLRYGPAVGDYPGLVTITNPGLTMYVITQLAPGTYYFTMTAYDSAGVESVGTVPVSKTL